MDERRQKERRRKRGQTNPRNDWTEKTKKEAEESPGEGARKKESVCLLSGARRKSWEAGRKAKVTEGGENCVQRESEGKRRPGWTLTETSEGAFFLLLLPSEIRNFLLKRQEEREKTRREEGRRGGKHGKEECRQKEDRARERAETGEDEKKE